MAAPSASYSAEVPWRLAETPPVDQGVWTRATGGLSNASVWRVELGEETFAVRRWWAGIDASYLWWMAETLRAAQTRGAPFVAAPFGGSLDRSWPYRDADDGRWEATHWKRGEPVSERSDEPAVVAAVRGLARFHDRVRSTDALPPAASMTLDRQRRRLNALLRDRPFAASPRTTARWPDVAELVARLPSACAVAQQRLAACEDPSPPQAVHGDARPEHFLINGGELAGLIDFGAMRVDSVLADVARLAGELSQGDADRRDAIVGLYESAAGVTVDRSIVAALDAGGAVIAGANWLRWLAEPDAPQRDARLVAERLRSILARLPTT